MTVERSAPVIGLVVNPLAGIGGEVGLGGSDGLDVQRAAAARGGTPRAPQRAERFVRELRRLAPTARILAAPGALGGDAAPGAELLDGSAGAGAAPTTAADTTRVAAELASRGVPLVVFVGGDGTARDVLRGVPEGQLCIGVPAGVKMHSGVFGITPEDAARQALEQLEGSARSEMRDVVDLDEEARRAGRLTTSVYGSMRVPSHARVQRGKRSPALGDRIDAAGIAEQIRAGHGARTLVFGPGTTVARVAEQFGVSSSLLGFDVLTSDGAVVAEASGRDLERVLEGRPFSVVLSPIGGQGFVIGRGNHQLSARVLRWLEPDRLVLVSDAAKLGALAGRLRIDAPTEALNERFRGARRIYLGAGEIAVGRIE